MAFQKGNSPWIKGRHHTAEAKRKMSEAGHGRKLPPRSAEWCKKLSESHKGQKTWLGRHHTQETKIKIGLAHAGKKRKPFSIKTRQKMSAWQRGTNNRCWRGGISPVRKRIRESGRYKLWRQNILIRDDFTCRWCNDRGGKLHVHHLKSFEVLLQEAWNIFPGFDKYDAALLYSPLWDVEWGVTVCEKCHKQEHGKE